MLAVAGLGPTSAQEQSTDPPPKVSLSLEDQFERRHDLASRAGDVAVLLYGDREGMPASKELGEKLHLHYHPTAKGQPPQKASSAPVIELKDLPKGKRSPDVHVIPVVCFIKAGPVIRNIVRGQVKRSAPDTPVWLDFEEKMKQQFGLTAGVTNIAVVDAKGRLRHRQTGNLDAKDYEKLLEMIDGLRKEAVGLDN
jgi:hypothetical protein